MIVLFLFACEEPRLPDPEVIEVVPSTGWNGEPTVITIKGRNFLSTVDFRADQRDVADEGGAFRVSLIGPGGADVRWPLSGVGVVDQQGTNLLAVVEPGLEVGLYHVEVVGPSGRWSVKEGAFTVSATRADHLSVSPAAQSWEVGQLGAIEVVLEDPSSELVLSPTEVVIEFESTDDEVVTLKTHDLVDAVVSDGQVKGKLQLGKGTVFLRRDSPGGARITARTAEPLGVASDTTQAFWTVGAITQLELALPYAGFVATAGEPFDVEITPKDELGNIVETPTLVTLEDYCQTRETLVQLSGVTTESVMLKQSSSSSCPLNRILTTSGNAQGASEGFEINPADTSTFQVLVLGFTPQAGTAVPVVVTPQDAFANTATWYGALTLDDSIGDVVGAPCVVEPGQPAALCSFVPQVAANNIEIEASADGIVGVSNTYSVAPNEIVATLQYHGPSRFTAGEAEAVQLRWLDAFGNWIEAVDSSQAPELILNDEVSCSFQQVVMSEFEYSCLFLQAGDHELHATWDAVSVVKPVQVVNSSLAMVEVELADEATAAEVVSIHLTGFDQFSNPYIHQGNSAFDLQSSGNLSVADGVFDGSGEADVSGFFTKAGPTQVVVSQDDLELGVSSTIIISAAPANSLRLTTEAFAYVDQPTTIDVEATDSFGNRSPWDGLVTLSSVQSAGDNVVVAISSGVGASNFYWHSPVSGDHLTASNGPGPGSTQEIEVMQICDFGPLVDFKFSAGISTACLDPIYNTASTTVDLSGSSAQGGATLDHFVVVGGEQTLVDTSAIFTVAVQGAGAHRLYGFAVDDQGCGAAQQLLVWSGEDDGSVVGPVEVSVPGAVNLLDTVTVELSHATDCSGDPAEDAPLFVRTTAGELSGLSPTGSGLQLVVDAAGEATLDLSLGAALSNSVGTLTIWEEASVTEVSFDVVGDGLRPTVVAQTPEGELTESTGQITITFSEPLLESTVLPGRFELSGAVPVSSVVVNGANVDLLLDDVLEPEIAIKLLTVSSNLRDEAGNLLDGGFEGVPSDFRGHIGGTAASIDSLLCVASTSSFRPDGDDGEGEDADVVVLEATSSTVSAYWRFQVRNGSGGLVYHTTIVPVSNTDYATWTGRGLDGLVVTDGEYDLQLVPGDGLGNYGDGCSIAVSVSNGER